VRMCALPLKALTAVRDIDRIPWVHLDDGFKI
jgi:hypothetical protein